MPRATKAKLNNLFQLEILSRERTTRVPSYRRPEKMSNYRSFGVDYNSTVDDSTFGSPVIAHEESESNIIRSNTDYSSLSVELARHAEGNQTVRSSGFNFDGPDDDTGFYQDPNNRTGVSTSQRID